MSHQEDITSEMSREELLSYPQNAPSMEVEPPINDSQSSAEASFAKLSAEQKKNLELYESLTEIVNELTSQNYLDQVAKIMALPIVSVGQLQDVVDLIFDKATRELDSGKLCADACEALQRLAVFDAETEKMFTFGEVLSDKCEQQLEQSVEVVHILNEEADHDTAIAMQELWEDIQREKISKSRRWIASCRFACTLFESDMLPTTIMLRFLTQLMTPPHGESLQYLCCFLSTIGEKLESKLSSYENVQKFTNLFDRMEKLSSQSTVLSQIKSMLREVTTLKENNWVPPKRRKTNPTEFPTKSKHTIQETPESSQWLEELSPVLTDAIKKIMKTSTKPHRNNHDFIEDQNDTLLEVFVWKFVNDEKSYGEIISWIDKNFLTCRNNMELVHKLMTIITRIIYNEWSKSGIYGEEKDSVIAEIIKKTEKILKFHINRFDHRIICLLTVDKVVRDLGYPEDMMTKICQHLHDLNLVSNNLYATLYRLRYDNDWRKNYNKSESRPFFWNIDSNRSLEIMEEGHNEVRMTVASSSNGWNVRNLLRITDMFRNTSSGVEYDVFYSTTKSFEKIYHLFTKIPVDIYNDEFYSKVQAMKFKRIDQLEYAASLIFKAACENPSSMVSLCDAMKNFSVGVKTFVMILNNEYGTYLFEIMSQQSAYDVKERIIFCQFLLALIAIRVIDEKIMVNFLSRLLRKNVELFCEIYEKQNFRLRQPKWNMENIFSFRLSDQHDLNPSVRLRLERIFKTNSTNELRFSDDTFRIPDMRSTRPRPIPSLHRRVLRLSAGEDYLRLANEITKLQRTQSIMMDELVKVRKTVESTHKYWEEIYNFLLDSRVDS